MHALSNSYVPHLGAVVVLHIGVGCTTTLESIDCTVVLPR